MRECDVAIVGGGSAGLAVARDLGAAGLHTIVLTRGDAQAAPPDGALVLEGVCVVDVVLSPEGRAAGVQLVARGGASVVRARAVVLATGGVAGLFPGGDGRGLGEGLVLAHRVGAATDARLEWAGDAPPAPRLSRGVAVDDGGRASAPGLYAAGAAAGGADARAVAKAVREDVAPDGALPTLGDRRVLHAIDAPLPEGFAHVKLERLRHIMGAHLTPEGPRDLAQADVLLHRLKGEADDFARARLDPQLHALQAAVEAAILLVRAARDG